jgi:hypothetical protein
MYLVEFQVTVGDCVIISRPRSNGRFASSIERLSTVSAVRPKSFDAGGLCFRYDGREWGGRSQVRLASTEEQHPTDSVAEISRADEERRFDRAEREREDLLLASLLTYRHETEWLRLGLGELRRIARLLGIQFGNAEPLEAADLNVNE